MSLLFACPSKVARINVRRSRSVSNCGTAQRAFTSILRSSGFNRLATEILMYLNGGGEALAAWHAQLPMAGTRW